jgi:N-acetylmuramoyl-L-alanine amidase
MLLTMKTRIAVTNQNAFRIGALLFSLILGTIAGHPIPPSQQSPTASSTTPFQAAKSGPTPPSGAPAGSPVQSAVVPPQRPSLNIVVLDPAHGGTDPGARGAGGLRESDVVLQFAAQVRRALEAQGFRVLQTRQGNEDPSLDDRSAMANANAQFGAVFVTLHVASTGLPETARVYVNTDLPSASNASGLIPWDRAQGPFLPLSHKLGDLVQGQLVQRFKGSPETAQTASVRQLRTTATPAIAVELSSVAVEDRAELDRMGPGVAEAIVRGIESFKSTYSATGTPGAQP